MGSREALAIFYCDRNEPKQRDPGQILRSIVRQLSCPEPGSELLRPVVDKYHEAKKGGFATGPLDPDECRDLIIQLLPSYPQSNIVIDALDECDKMTRSKLLSVLAAIMASKPNLVKIFISSRDDDDLVLRLNKVPTIRISSKDNSEDIARFVQSEIDTRIARRELLRGNVPNDLRDYIIETIIKGADGMLVGYIS